MKTNQLYKHTNNIDVAFGPMEIETKEDGSLALKGFWFNIGGIQVVRICLDSILITKDQIHSWIAYEHPLPKMQDMPPDFEKVFQENFTDLLAQ
jgi:hypothetical protein